MTSKNFVLSDLCEIVSSKRVFAADYKDEGVPFFRGKEVSQLARGENVEAELFISEAVYQDAVSRTGKISPGDVLLTAVGTLGNVYRVKEGDQEFYFKDGNVVWLRNFRPDVDSSFLTHWLGSPLGRKKVLNTAIGSTQAALTITGLSQIQIELPSLLKQRAIADFLDTTDSLIRLNQSIASNLERIAQTIFKSWFVDFDPVHAKARGEQPEGMDAETAALFPDSFEDSELGLSPTGWALARLGSRIRVIKGKSYKTSELTESDTALVTLKSFKRGGGYRPDGLKAFSGAYKSEQVIDPGELVVSFTDVTQAADVIGKPAIVLPTPKYSTLVASLDVGIVRTTSKQVGRHYLYQLFLTSRFKSHVEGYTNGTTVLHLGKGALEDFMAPLPSEEVLQKFEAITEPLWAQVQALYAENLLLEELREALLPRLISGELQIPEQLLVD